MFVGFRGVGERENPCLPITLRVLWSFVLCFGLILTTTLGVERLSGPRENLCFQTIKRRTLFPCVFISLNTKYKNQYDWTRVKININLIKNKT